MQKIAAALVKSFSRYGAAFALSCMADNVLATAYSALPPNKNGGVAAIKFQGAANPRYDKRFHQIATSGEEERRFKCDGEEKSLNVYGAKAYDVKRVNFHMTVSRKNFTIEDEYGKMHYYNVTRLNEEYFVSQVGRKGVTFFRYIHFNRNSGEFVFYTAEKNSPLTPMYDNVTYALNAKCAARLI